MSVTKLKREQQVLLGIIVAVVAAVVVYYMYLVRPLLAKVVDLERNIHLEEQKLQHVEQLVAQEPKLRTEHQELSKAMQALRDAMPPEQELASVIEHLSGLASTAGVKIQTIFPQRSLENLKVVANLNDPAAAAAEPKLYKDIPIQIEALTGFHQLGAFLGEVERGKQPMQLKSLRITENFRESRRHTVEMIVVAYFAVSNAKSDAAAQASAAAAQAVK